MWDLKKKVNHIVFYALLATDETYNVLIAPEINNAWEICYMWHTWQNIQQSQRLTSKATKILPSNENQTRFLLTLSIFRYKTESIFCNFLWMLAFQFLLNV